MDLGLAMAGANAFFKEQQAQDIRDREKQRYEWEKARAEAEMSTLPDKTAADRSGFQLRAGQNQQGIELLPGETANKKTEQGIKTTELTGQQNRLPQTEETKDINAGMGLATAKAEQEMQSDVIQQKKNVQTIATAVSNLDVEELPRTLAQKRLQNEISQSDSDVMIAAKLSDLIDAGDTTSIVRLLNAQKKTITDPKIAGLPDVASVARAKDANGVEYLVLKDAKGNQITARPIEGYRAAKSSLAKIDYKTVDAGDSLVRVQGGKVTPVYTAPESEKSKATKAGPLERDVNYLSSTFGMSQEQALAHLNSAKTMSRSQFILKSVQDLIAIGKQPTPDQEKQIGEVYDRITSGKP